MTGTCGDDIHIAERHLAAEKVQVAVHTVLDGLHHLRREAPIAHLRKDAAHGMIAEQGSGVCTGQEGDDLPQPVGKL